MIRLKFKRVGSYAYEPPLPSYQTPGSAGMDIRAAESGVIPSGCRVAVGTGWAAEVPEGYELQIRPRSGLALRSAIVANFGTIDSDYRGEIKVILHNLCEKGYREFLFSPGDRIAQLVLAPVIRADPVQAEELSETKRGEGGFGHTGV